MLLLLCCMFPMSSPTELPLNPDGIEDFAFASSGQVLYKNKYQLSSNVSSSVSCYVYDNAEEQTTEISRDTFETDGDTASISLGVLHEPTPGDKKIVPVLKANPTETEISSVSADSVCNLTINGSIAWDRNDACLYLSANKAFRFRFLESDGILSSRLVLEGYSEENSAYLPKAEFSTD